MLTPSNLIHRTKRSSKDRLGEIRKNIASAMVGKTVSLVADARTIARGMVAGVMVETGTPKIVVNGRSYGLNQILSVCPASLN
jgi:hypothetical protein